MSKTVNKLYRLATQRPRDRDVFAPRVGSGAFLGLAAGLLTSELSGSVVAGSLVGSAIFASVNIPYLGDIGRAMVKWPRSTERRVVELGVGGACGVFIGGGVALDSPVAGLLAGLGTALAVKAVLHGAMNEGLSPP